MMLREALWPSEGDTDAIIHADKTDCPMFGFGDGSADGSIVEKWNICSSDDEDDFPSDGSCIRCGSVPRNANGLCNTCLDEDAERLENTRPAPAATDTGLETVAWQDFVPSTGWVASSPSSIAKDKRELVTRSQAVELLAAERAAHDNTIATLSSLIEDNAALIHDLNRIKDHETELVNDNVAQAARIKELEKLCNDTEAEALGYASDKAELEAKLADAEKALEPFADHANDRAVDDTGWRDKDTVKIVVSIGDLRKARAVLGGKPS